MFSLSIVQSEFFKKKVVQNCKNLAFQTCLSCFGWWLHIFCPGSVLASGVVQSPLCFVITILLGFMLNGGLLYDRFICIYKYVDIENMISSLNYRFKSFHGQSLFFPWAEVAPCTAGATVAMVD